MDREHSAQQTKQSRWGFRGMTVRNWLDLLIVPLVLVGIGLLFEMQQADRQQAMEEQQQALEERRAEAERALAERRAQDEALQAYLDQMSTLMLEKDLRESKVDSEVRTLARARTLTVLRRLDTTRKGEIIQFLLEANLVHRVGESEPVIELDSADLSGADLSGADLSNADLSYTNLSNADLSNTLLVDAALSGAVLSDADLRHAIGITNATLERQAKSLEGATMPDGQKYEDWRKDRESRKVDE